MKGHFEYSYRTFVYFFGLTLQCGIQPLTVSYFIGPDVLIPVVVLVTEMMKICITLISFCFYRPPELKNWNLRKSFLLAGIPAASYAFQNHFIYLAMINLDGVTFTIQGQLKIVFTAVFVYIFLKQVPRSYQIISMVFFLLAAILVGTIESTPVRLDANHSLGLIYGFLGNILSGFGSVISQKALQNEKRDSILFSGELAFFSTTIQLGTFFFRPNVINAWLESSDSYGSFVYGNLFQGFNAITFLPIFTQALGGFLVGLVTKHAGSMEKGYSIICGFLITTVSQMMLEGKSLPTQMITAIVVAMFAMYLSFKGQTSGTPQTPRDNGKSADKKIK